MVSYHPDPPQPLRARLRLALHGYGGNNLNRLVHHQRGRYSLTLNQARKAAEVYQRPFALLFLPEPPTEDPVEVQFRRLRDAPALPWPPSMRTLARQVLALQDEADALFDMATAARF